jgi:hypothetical protein
MKKNYRSFFKQRPLDFRLDGGRHGAAPDWPSATRGLRRWIAGGAPQARAEADPRHPARGRVQPLLHHSQRKGLAPGNDQRPILNFTPGGGQTVIPGAKMSPRGELCPLGVKISVRHSILLNGRVYSPLGINKELNIPPIGQISPLGDGDEVKNGLDFYDSILGGTFPTRSNTYWRILLLPTYINFESLWTNFFDSTGFQSNDRNF